MSNILIGSEIASNKLYRTLVFQATHDAGDNRLPLMHRSFISFTYGGKNIEDFGLIAITENNSMDRNVYANFSDLITESDVVNGQFYWATHYDANELNLFLFTDEITERQLTSFSLWFKPGFARELILAEHPNRGILARVAEPPKYHMLPFEKKIRSTIYGSSTSTTVYKGKIELHFIMDDPFWYSIVNILDLNESHPNQWFNISTKLYENIMNSKDALKIIEEDGIPTTMSLRGNLILTGTNITVNVTRAPARVAYEGEILIIKNGIITNPEIRVGSDSNDLYAAKIGGEAEVTNLENGIDIGKDEVKYFYYPGTAPCAPIIEFTIDFNTNGGICNTVNNTYSNPSKPYNSIFIKSVTEQRELRFTTPSFITAYNLAIRLSGGTDEEKRDGINHYKVRAAAINNTMTTLFNGPTTADFKINCETGEVKVEYSNLTELENAGDMIRSKYLIIEDRNYPDEYGYIHNWDEDHPEYSHKIWHDLNTTLKNVKLTYNYKYL